ncbi:CAP domain-containing protein [Pilobolus umbonatus]|nr:CAP domain-containing protein [Pilobolus umbonatus]
MIQSTKLAVFFLVLAIVHSVTALSASAITSILKVHNDHRAKHHSPALVWNTTMATYAQKWVNKCKFAHSNGPYGENLAMGYPNWPSAVNGWYNEVSKYNFDKPGYKDTTGHFTQVVWKGTREIGCGVKTCTNYGNAKIYMCNYKEFGNIVTSDNSYFIKNVLAP